MIVSFMSVLNSPVVHKKSDHKRSLGHNPIKLSFLFAYSPLGDVCSYHSGGSLNGSYRYLLHFARKFSLASQRYSQLLHGSP